MAQIFAAFGKFGTNNKGSIQNFGIVGITIASEEITKFIFFFCPCDYPLNEVYGSTFIWGPAAILLVVGYVVNRRTWRLTTGMCNRTQGVGKGCKRLFHFIFIFINITMKAVLAPATWIVISFLKGDYYACAAWPAPDSPYAHSKFNLHVNTTIPPPCSFSSKPQLFDQSTPEIIARDLRAYSHIIGWWFLTWALLIGVCAMFIFRCMSKYSYEQSKYIEKYRGQEMKLFEEALDAKAAAQAKIVVDQFFTTPRKKEEWDQIASINDKVMKSKRGRPIYSPLHKFVNKELVAMELAQLDIVSDSAKKKHHLNIWKKKPGQLKTKSTQAAKTGTKSNAGAAAGTGIQMMALSTMRTGGAHKVSRPPPEMKTGTFAPHNGNDKNQAVVESQAGGFGNQGTENLQVEQPQQNTTNIPTQLPATENIPNVQMQPDPIQEANVDVNPEVRRSLMETGVSDEDPIREANLSEHPEIQESLQSLHHEEEDIALEITEEDDHDSIIQGEEIENMEQDDSHPLLS